MPMCAVYGCSERGSGKTNVHIHRFPSDEETRKIWILKCKRSEIFNTESSVICSRHFRQSDYRRHLKYELLNIPVPTHMIQLKKEAVPSLFLPSNKRKQTKKGK